MTYPNNLPLTGSDPARPRIGNGVYTREDYVDLVLQFPQETMPDGFERSLQNQYAVRNRASTDRLARSRPTRPSDPGSDLTALEQGADAPQRAT